MDYDYIVIGSGGAGLYAALKAQEFGRVLLLTKGALGEGSTPLAQGGIAAAIGPEDSDELHQKDTLVAGNGLCNQSAVAVLVSEATECIEDLLHLGVPFDYNGTQIALGLEGAHSVPRVVHAGGDATGLMLQRALERQIEYLDRITVLDEHLVTGLIVSGGVCHGVRALALRTGQHTEFASRFVVLAMGGFGQLFAHTTNSAGATGDGIAIALRAGAAITDMEFMQFHPTVLCLPSEHQFLISEAVRGEGAILRDVNGRAFMKDYDARGELAPRDVVSRAIVTEMEKSDQQCVYLDITHLPAAKIRSRFPTIYSHCKERGIDMASSLIPVAPAAHYSVGGVKTNLWGETAVSNLFACGEVACTGVHGANRLASNSLLELLVFGRRVIRRTVDRLTCKVEGESAAHASEDRDGYLIEVDLAPGLSAHSSPPTLQEVRSLAWQALGVARHGASLEKVRKTFEMWQASTGPQSELADYEMANLILVGRMVAEAAAARRESRGCHYRLDFPQKSANWQRHIVLRRRGEEQ